MIERFKQKLIAEKDFLLKWLDIVLNSTSAFDIDEASSNYKKIKEAILTNWNQCKNTYFDISLGFYNENACGNPKGFKNSVYSIDFNFYWEGDYISLEIRKDSIDSEGYHCIPDDEEYLLCYCFYKEDEFTYFEDNATKKFLEVYYQHTESYPNWELPDIRTEIYLY